MSVIAKFLQVGKTFFVKKIRKINRNTSTVDYPGGWVDFHLPSICLAFPVPAG